MLQIILLAGQPASFLLPHFPLVGSHWICPCKRQDIKNWKIFPPAHRFPYCRMVRYMFIPAFCMHFSLVFLVWPSRSEHQGRSHIGPPPWTRGVWWVETDFIWVNSVFNYQSDMCCWILILFFITFRFLLTTKRVLIQ